MKLVYRLATKSPEEDVDPIFLGKYISVALVLVGRSEMLETMGPDVYINFIRRHMRKIKRLLCVDGWRHKKNYHRIFSTSVNSRKSNIAFVCAYAISTLEESTKKYNNINLEKKLSILETKKEINTKTIQDLMISKTFSTIYWTKMSCF